MGINKDSQKAPNLRFKGFTDDWEQRKFGNFIEEYVEKTTSQNQYPVLTSSQQVGIVLQEDYFSNRQVTTSKNIGYFVLPKGYFTYRSRSDNGVFVFNRNDSIDKGIISYFYPVFRVINADSDFFLRRINFGVGHQIAIAAEGTGQHVLSLKKFKDIRAMFPVIQEQVKIGNLFSQLDIIITLHQRKLDQLNQLKEALLQQMFPGKGETVPKLRFAGFEGAWEERKLGAIGNTFTGLSGKTKEDFGHGEAKYIPYTNIFNNPITDVDKLESIEIDNKQNSVVYGDILFTTSSETPEEVGMSSVWMYEKENVYLNSFCFGFRPIEEHYPLYLAYLLRSPYMRKKFTILAQGISRYNISKNKVLELTISLPSISEQTKIGDTLKHLDDIITLQQRKLDQLKNTKQVLLQNMFI